MKYNTRILCHTFFEAEVEADSAEQAREKALENYLKESTEKQLLENIERYGDVEIEEL